MILSVIKVDPVREFIHIIPLLFTVQDSAKDQLRKSYPCCDRAVHNVLLHVLFDVAQLFSLEALTQYATDVSNEIILDHWQDNVKYLSIRFNVSSLLELIR